MKRFSVALREIDASHGGQGSTLLAVSIRRIETGWISWFPRSRADHVAVGLVADEHATGRRDQVQPANLS
jgi:hypothetical protein